MEQLRAVQR